MTLALFVVACALAAAAQGRTREACPRHFPLTWIQDAALLHAPAGEEISEVSEEVAASTAPGSCPAPPNEPRGVASREGCLDFGLSAPPNRDLDALRPELRSLQNSLAPGMVRKWRKGRALR